MFARSRVKPWVAGAMLVAGVLAGGCGTPPVAPAPPAATEAPRPIGGDRDGHGCLPAAGYRWCGHTARCERPWELAQAKGFDNTVEGFDRYCALPSAG
ncbi:hypothetical protein MNQ95_06355 [Pseudoxanthomonas daejeonensis]|uniref:hypothetical protein n=1 Tax=Pseudoxanthomonas daejeonensis TaxID=266062 RepID=UPI001F53F87A|nr:hypothetical protein [Pseudoxanthomonas daejeonensis]UNK58705.1 hypothetical protein MNQ95_06355 [Pseudoxanthomonas daejeonensis]